MNLVRDVKIKEIYQEIKDNMLIEVQNSDVIDYYAVAKVELNFLIYEIAKLKLEIEELKYNKKNI